MPRKFYVVGFMFDGPGQKVVLIEKKKFPPNTDWAATPYNGVGGKLEDKETGADAMVREFFEETGVKTEKSEWTRFCTMYSTDWVVYFFKSFSTLNLLNVRTMETEPISIHNVTSLPAVVKNLRWAIPMALDNFLSDVHIKHLQDPVS